MKATPGLDLLVDEDGAGPRAAAGDTVVYAIRMYLNRGDEVPQTEPEHTTILGKRLVIAGIENALYDMQVGGHRRVRVSSHLAYGRDGVPGKIPRDAVLEIDIWLRAIVPR